MNNVIEATADTFEALVLRSPVRVAVDFYSESCGPCRILMPMLGSLAEAIGDRGRIVTVNVAGNERLAVEHRITAVPTILLFEGGREIGRMVGLGQLSGLREAMTS